MLDQNVVSGDISAWIDDFAILAYVPFSEVVEAHEYGENFRLENCEIAQMVPVCSGQV